MLRADITYLTTADLAHRWKRSSYTICEYAKQGRIRGAEKDGNGWRFPENAELLPSAKKAACDPGPLAEGLAGARRRLAELKREARERA
jgi:hypothetical protein